MKLIEDLVTGGVIEPVDAWFVRYLQGIQPMDEPCALAAALASRASGDGHVCLDLVEMAGRPLEMISDAPVGPAACPELASWERSLAGCPHVGPADTQTPQAPDTQAPPAPGEPVRPLVWDRRTHRLYLHRFWLYERSLAEWVLEKASDTPAIADPGRLRDDIERFFPADEGSDGQRLAALAAARKRFAVITGGPGTGKTTVASRVLQIWAGQSPGRTLRVVLAAPTGKASERLAEAMGEPPAGTRVETMTVHRLLGRLSREGVRKPDAIIVDEASMADLALLSALVSLVPETTRLVLLGDKDQLSSVEAGAVLGDICAGPAERVPYSSTFAQAAATLASVRLERSAETGRPLRDSIVVLRHSYRFPPEGGIGALSRAVNAGSFEQAAAVLRDPAKAGVSWRESWDGSDLERRIVAGFTDTLTTDDPQTAFQRYRGFCVLTALRSGSVGAPRLNLWIERRLAAAGLVASGRLWYRGRPILITRNDYALRLYNGDVGLVLPQPEDGELRVFFPDPEGGFRRVAPTRLPEHETAYALTVHKSQGSEYREVLFVLPPTPARVLSRELVYTAITRARESFELWGEEPVLRAAIARTVHRASGLREALWGAND